MREPQSTRSGSPEVRAQGRERPHGRHLLLCALLLPAVQAISDEQPTTTKPPEGPAALQGAGSTEEPIAPPPELAAVPADNEASSISTTARTLFDRGLAMNIATTSKADVEVEIGEGAERYALPLGPSPALLVRLSDYSRPFSLVLRSYPSNGFRKAVFVPIVAFLDEDFRVTHQVGEAALKWKSLGFGKQHFECEISMGDEEREDRYLFVFTDGRRMSEIVRSNVNTAVTSAGTVSIPSSISRSFWGDIRLETKPKS